MGDIINVVSARKNKNTNSLAPGDEWRFIVRDADRIEAVGEVGIARCYAYNQKVGAPLFVDTTPKCTTVEEVWKEATAERFQAYNGDSNSMVDHYFDKLLHLENCASGNKYLESKLKERLQIMIDFVLDFGRTGQIDTEHMESLKAKYCTKKSKPKN